MNTTTLLLEEFSPWISQLPQAYWALTWISSVGATSWSRPGGRSYRTRVTREQQCKNIYTPHILELLDKLAGMG